MMLGVIPLIPIAWMAVGALLGGGAVGVATHDWKAKPPYEKPADAYKNYVKAVEGCEYERYQWSVVNPVQEAEFTMWCSQRKNQASITEGLDEGRISWWGDEKNEARANVISPWDRTEKKLCFRKVGNSWKVIENR